MSTNPEYSHGERYAFTPENIDPATAVETILHDPELEAMARGDSEHLRFLQGERLAALRVVLDPENPDAQEEFLKSRRVLQVYENYGKGVRRIPLPKQ